MGQGDGRPKTSRSRDVFSQWRTTHPRPSLPLPRRQIGTGNVATFSCAVLFRLSGSVKRTERERTATSLVATPIIVMNFVLFFAVAASKGTTAPHPRREKRREMILESMERSERACLSMPVCVWTCVIV